MSSAKPNFRPALVEDVQTLKRSAFGTGPWTTKSGGQLSVLFALPHFVVEAFSNYDAEELAKIPFDIRGIRSYQSVGMPKGNLGGGEFHRIRVEAFICLTGAIRWVVEDARGDSREFHLVPGTGVLMPPFILHTYEVLENASSFIVLCNTLFDPNDQSTQDTYSLEEFRKIQLQFE